MLIRAATSDDLPAIARLLVECNATYVEFAPAGWRAVPYEMQLEHERQALSLPERWVAVGEQGGVVVAYAAFVDARLTRVPVNEPGLAHLGRLFVDPSHWGSGAAVTMHARALDEAAARDFTAIRLFTPTAHGRARRFYEREGWQAVGEAPGLGFGMPLTEYRRDL